jgi:hypothetical protein
VEAVITGIFGVVIVGVGWFLKRFDRRNTDQHFENKAVLDRIEGKIDSHIAWHLGPPPSTVVVVNPSPPKEEAA